VHKICFCVNLAKVTITGGGMKIVRFEDDRIGILDHETVVDISDLISHREYRGGQGSMEELITNFDRYRPEIANIVARGAGRPLDKVRLLAPLPRPSRVLAAFVNYLDKPHRTPESLPLEFFHKSPHLVGPGGNVELPDVPAIKEFHAEAELAFVVGKLCKGAKAEDWKSYVFGYVPFFDVSARGLTRRSQLLPKGQETFAACGPWITTADEISDPHDLTVKSWVSGTLRQNYSTRFMAHKIPAQIAWLSRFVHLRPGDMVATGVFHEGLTPINCGDEIAIEINGLGRASFNVTGESPHKAAGFQPGGGQRMEMTAV
jgi:2-keto-4-pentenoate hydratase/2-oxohepta-3-ene-1,7-dioic acid hydratase in catechol pathway